MRILHAPVSIAGMAKHICDYFREQGLISDFIIYQTKEIHPDANISLGFESCVGWKKVMANYLIKPLFFLFCLFNYTHFNFYFGKSLLPNNWDLPILKLFRKKIVMTYCGSDIRLIEIEQKRNSYIEHMEFGRNRIEFDDEKRRMMRWQNLWVDKFIAPRNATRHALTELPKEKVESELWVHNAGDVDRLLDKKLVYHEVPLIIHAPTQPEIKGTKFIESAIKELRERELEFEYERVQNIPYDEAIEKYHEADIIVDQLFHGGFGTLAVEGMALGKPVCSYLIESVKQKHFPNCPIVEVNKDNLSDKLSILIEDSSERKAIGQAGREYVREKFDKERIFSQLRELYQNL